MSEVVVMRVLAEQRKRCLASILGAAESAGWWNALGRDEQTAYKESVRGALGIFYDLCRDIVRVTEGDVIRNDHAVELIEHIHSHVVTERRSRA